MTPIEKLKALESAATPGLWQQTTSGDAHWLREVRDSENRGLAWCGHSHLASAHGDARFITIFRNLVPHFIVLKEAVDAYRKSVDSADRAACLMGILAADDALNAALKKELG